MVLLLVWLHNTSIHLIMQVLILQSSIKNVIVIVICMLVISALDINVTNSSNFFILASVELASITKKSRTPNSLATFFCYRGL